MKVFISWSKPKSHEVALILRDWLPSVIQSLEPFVSSEEIDKGTRWGTEIAEELEKCSLGILCVTEENLQEPWLMFEAGALSKKIRNSFVCPFLLGVQRSDVKGPLVQFQSTVFEKEDVGKLLSTINSACGESGISTSILDKAFEVWWPSLKEQLKKVEMKKDSSITSSSSKLPKKEDMMEELLELSRRNQRLLSHPEELLPAGYLELIIRSAINNRIPEQLFQGIQMNYALLSEIRKEWDVLFPSIDQVLMGSNVERANLEMLIQGVRHFYSRIVDLQQSFWNLLSNFNQ